MGSENEQVHTPEEPDSRHEAGDERQRDAGGRGRGVDPRALDVDIDPVRDTERDLRDRIESGGEDRRDARRQLELTGGIEQGLKYLEKAVPLEDFGPDPGNEDARRDLAIVLGDLAHKYDMRWLRAYEDEIFALGLAFSLYGGPVLTEYGPRVWEWYTSKLRNATSRPRNDPSRETPIGENDAA
jgi:hypothetical protein